MVMKSESESATSWRYRVIYAVLLTAWIVGVVTLLNKGQVEGGRGQGGILHQHGQAPATESETAHVPMSVLSDVRDGQLAALNDYPFMAALCDVSGSCFCGAVIIDEEQVLGVAEPSSKKYLLTAAHCFYDDRGRFISNVQVYMGFVDKANLPPVWSGYMLKESWYYKNSIARGGIAIHPNYVNYEGAHADRNDIAVLKLNKKMPWVAGSTNTRSGYTYGTVGPINVVGAGQAPPADGRILRVIGWGLLKPAPPIHGPSRTTNDLRWANVRVMGRAACNTLYETVRRSVPLSGTFCAGGPETGTKKDPVYPVTCPGDSGGPIVQGDPTSGYTLRGITQMGIMSETYRHHIQCAAYPAVYTDVSAHIPWIKAVLAWMKGGQRGSMPGVPGAKCSSIKWPELWT